MSYFRAKHILLTLRTSPIRNLILRCRLELALVEFPEQVTSLAFDRLEHVATFPSRDAFAFYAGIEDEAGFATVYQIRLTARSKLRAEQSLHLPPLRQVANLRLSPEPRANT